MTTTFLTRADDGVGDGLYDSIAWAFEVHVKQPDNPAIVCALLYGNEDAPDKIEFFDVDSYDATPILTWEPEAETDTMREEYDFSRAKRKLD